MTPTTPITPHNPKNPSQLTSKATVSVQLGNPCTARKPFALWSALPLAGALLVGAMLVNPPDAHAQNADTSNARVLELRQATVERAANQKKIEVKHKTELVTLNFPGGTLEEYIDALKKAMLPAAANIMIRGNLGDIPMDEVQLEDVPLANAMDMIGGDYQIENTYYQIRVREYTKDKGRSAYTLEVSRQGQFGGQATSNQIIVLSLKELTTALPGDPPEVVIPAETVLTAIETALSVADDQATKTEVRYHAESGLLIVSGTPKTLGIAKDVIETITKDVRNRRDRARDLLEEQGLANPDAIEEELANAQADAEMTRVRIGEAEQLFEISQQSVGDTQADVDAGTLSIDALRRAQQNLAQAASDIKEQQIMLQRAERRVEQLEHALDRSRQLVSGSTPDDEMNALREENAMLRDHLEMLQAQRRPISDHNTDNDNTKDGDH